MKSLFAPFWICLLLICHSALAQDRPNIVFMYADDLGFADLACNGHPEILTPNLDRLAAEGVNFQSFTVGSPVCSPSRTAIVTGQFPSRWGIHQHIAGHTQNVERNMPDWLDPKAPLLPRILKEAGYRTGHYGKWHLGGSGVPDAPLPEAYGYDDAACWTGAAKHVFVGTDYAKMEQEGGAHDVHAASFLSVAATDHAIEFIRESGDQPFYINLWFHETHHLVSATDADKEPYPNTPEPQRTYYAAVTRMDRQVGRVLETLEELGKTENTFILFSSDNGPENSHPKLGQKFYYSVGFVGELKGRKRSLQMGGINVPFLARWPGQIPAGTMDRTTALSGVDVFPTLLAAANVPVPDGYQGDGQNMLDAFRGAPQERKEPLFWWWQGRKDDHYWPEFATRDGDWLLIYNDEMERTELYNVIEDRAQTTDLAVAQPERVTTMRQAVEKWFGTIPMEVDPSLRSKAAAPVKRDPNAPPDREAAFLKKDLNRDNQLTLEEYLHNFPDAEEGKRRFPNFDDNKDGVLSREEFITPGKK